MAFITTSWSCLLLLMGAALVASAPSSHSYSSSARSFHNLMEPKQFDGHGTFRNTPEDENTETVGETEVSEEAVRVTNIPEEAVEESYKAPEDQFFNTDHKDEQSQAPEEEDQYEEPQDGHLKDSEDDHSEEPEDEEDQNKEPEHEDPVDDRSENDDLEDSEEDHSEESEEEKHSEEFEDEEDHSELSRMVLFVGYPVGESL
ncbi:glutamic acid-rich protein-like [Homarus americanus]|uniref:glutamic acid-rich protein-like n=1 Tax=Homarus americanus TaxID=6706 RepID=UPI001C485213|nr:glutamic acid-rich protein-like [Homarus americanus]